MAINTITDENAFAYRIAIYHSNEIRPNFKNGVFKSKKFNTQKRFIEKAMKLLKDYKTAPIARAIFYPIGDPNPNSEIGRFENGIFSGRLFQMYQLS